MDIIKPMLATPVSPLKLQKFAEDDNWYFQQKVDGERLMIYVEDGRVEGWNRNGYQVQVSPSITKSFQHLDSGWVFDGELVGNIFYMFDLPRAKGFDTISAPYTLRHDALRSVYGYTYVGSIGVVSLLTTAETTEEKKICAGTIWKTNGEGVMIKHKNGIYSPGLRTTDTLKAKFTATIDCVVSVVGREGKSSIGLEVYDQGRKIDVGACKVEPATLAKLNVGDVVEVKYLYGTESNKVYQPSFLRQRDDKAVKDCLLDQMKYGNKQAIL